MRKLDNILERKFIKEIIDPKKKDFFHPILKDWENRNYSTSKIYSRLKILIDIENLHGKNSLKEYEKYFKSSQKERLRIRYGDKRVKKFEDKLKSRPKPKVVSHFTKKYWIDKGYTKEEAISAIAKVQAENSKKRTKDSYKNHSKKLKFSLEYWIDKGYTKEEAVELRKPYLLKTTQSLESYIDRYGDEIGPEKYFIRIEKFKKTLKDNLSNRSKAGYVSKESIKFFIPLYKACRKLGIDRSNIYIGLNGSKEFFLRRKENKNSGRFVDFCIPSLNIIIEYNGSFWHPREEENWRNPLVSYNDAKKRDDEVKHLSKQRKFDLFIVWDDDNHHDKLTDLIKEIGARFEYNKR